MKWLPPDHQLLISSFNSGTDTHPGGLLACDGQSVKMIDNLATTGLCWNGQALARSYWHKAQPQGLAVFSNGTAWHWPLPDLIDPHDLSWDETNESWVAIATGHNELLWVNQSGQVWRRWNPGGVGDSWHLNGLVWHNGRLLVTAFGEYKTDREWMGRVIPDSPGLMIDVESGEKILTKLRAPHSPRFIDGSWVVCNSVDHELVQLGSDGHSIVRRAKLEGWTRGLAVTDNLIFVGVSTQRRPTEPNRQGQPAHIAVLDRHSWEVLGKIELPIRDVYDVLLVPSWLVQAIGQPALVPPPVMPNQFPAVADRQPSASVIPPA